MRAFLAEARHLPWPVLRWITTFVVIACSGATGTEAPITNVAVVLVSVPSPIAVGGTAVATVAIRDSAGNSLSNRTVAWSSSNASIASVDPTTGVVRGIATGSASINATCEGKRGQATVTITPPAPAPVAKVTVILGLQTIGVGATTTATATVADSAGHLLSGRSVSWSSANPSVATVDTTGSVRGVAPGSAAIIATSEGKSGQTTLTVTAAPPPVATQLAITTQPSASATSGQPLPQQPVIQLEDASGNPVSQSGVVVTASVASGGGTLSGTTSATTNSNGVAAYSNLTISGSGAQTLRFTASNLTPVTSGTITVSTSTTGGTLLFAENFDDTNFGARGWYDLPAGGITSLSSNDHITGSTMSLQMNFLQGATNPNPKTAARHQFTPSTAVYLRYWVKYSSNWVGSGKTYHPHEFYFLTTEDDAYASPAYAHLVMYVEENFQSSGGFAVLSAQDAMNIDTTRINQDLTTVTENRAVSGCNGDPDGTSEITCYTDGTYWYNGKTWRSANAVFLQTAGAGYKGDWHKVEAYFKLNSIVNGIAQNDGVAQYWFDGQLVVDHHNLQLRTGAHPNMQFNQLLMAPYIGDGSPITQTMWFDDMVVMTAPPSP